MPTTFDAPNFQRSTLGQHLWMPLDFGVPEAMFSGTEFYQESTRTTAATAQGDPVGNWGDLSGNARHALQATGSARGTLYPTGLNGLPFVRFASDTLKTAAFAAVLPQPLTRITVCRINTISGSPIFVDGIDGTNLARLGITTTALFARAGTTYTDTTLPPDTEWHVYVQVLNGAASDVYRDGKWFSSNLGTNGLQGMSLGADFGNGAYCDCDIAFDALYKGAFTPHQVNDYTWMLATRYALTRQISDVFRPLFDDFESGGSTFPRRTSTGHLLMTTGSANGVISGGRAGLAAVDANFLYIYTRGPRVPAAMGGKFVFDNSLYPDASLSEQITMGSFVDPSASLNNMGWHIYQTAGGCGAQYRRNAEGTFPSVNTQVYATSLDLTGRTVYSTSLVPDARNPKALSFTPATGNPVALEYAMSEVRSPRIFWEIGNKASKASTWWTEIFAQFAN